MNLRDIAWMRVQWKRFRRVLGGATGVVWLLCCTGIILMGGEEEIQWFWARMALLFMLASSTAVSLWLFFTAWREMRRLKDLAAEIRIEDMQAERDKKKKRARRRGRHSAPTADHTAADHTTADHPTPDHSAADHPTA